ncbi:MAG: tryptophan/tyrosine permease [Gammaproteobacteria bacterium]|nr:tryptophan/tyrosine permease [Gammaproteobacteria bacterium]MCW5583472.1 tryptophan/tyrosine permease [Gammaproteobacteria bacterium]
MDFKLLGSILLVVGTSVGAGMLALPIATAQLGFLGSLILLFVCWFVMTAGAFLILEVNLWMPNNSNLNTMARTTIGPIGQIISWLAFLSLLYSLLCAYIGGGSDLFHHLLFAAGMDVPQWIAAIIFTVVFGSVVFLGIRSVDYVNRGLMFVKFGAYFLLVALLLPLTSSVKLAAGNIYHITSTTAITVTITSFGYAAIVPSLRIYFAGDVKKLKKAIFLGSLIPLFCYIAWDAVIMGIVPLDGEKGLVAILNSQRSTSDLVNALSLAAATGSITFFAQLFTSICVLTSFLGVALCLTDFWADGLQLEKKGNSNLIVTVMTFLPPLIVVLFFPGIFVKALQYAGIYCIVLLILLPAWMAWVGRYKRKIAKDFIVPGGKWLLVLLMVLSLTMIIKGLLG